MKSIRPLMILLALGLAACASAPVGNQPPIKIPRIIPYQEGAANEVLRRECDFDTYLAQRIAEVGAKRGIPVQLTDENLEQAGGRVLLIRTSYAYAIGGAGYSGGGKKARIRGELRENGQVIGDFHIQRNTRGKWTACGTLDHIADALAKDTVVWLTHPSMGWRQGLDR